VTSPYAAQHPYPQTQVAQHQLEIDFTPPGEEEVDIKDFTIKKKTIPFRIDDDVFNATAILSIPMMQNLIRVSRDLGDMMKNDDFSALEKVFSELLLSPGNERFTQRLRSNGVDGIDVKRQVLPIMHYLLEQYGLRPTQPSSDSLAGLPSGTDGTSSTAGFSQLDITSDI
jgi:hypothetical protein